MKNFNFISLLSDFVAKCPGFDLSNYPTIQHYRRDYYKAFKYKNAYELLLIQAERIFSIEDINAALGERLKNNPGRLSYNIDQEQLQYCTGQYFPVEYRYAAFSVLLCTVWDLTRNLLQEGKEEHITEPEIRAYLNKRFRGNKIALKWINN